MRAPYRRAKTCNPAHSVDGKQDAIRERYRLKKSVTAAARLLLAYITLFHPDLFALQSFVQTMSGKSFGISTSIAMRDRGTSFSLLFSLSIGNFFYVDEVGTCKCPRKISKFRTGHWIPADFGAELVGYVEGNVSLGWNGICIWRMPRLFSLRHSWLRCHHQELRVFDMGDYIHSALSLAGGSRLDTCTKTIISIRVGTLSSPPYNLHIFIFRHHQQLSVKCNLQ
jgi:hypothetical protein